MRNNLLLFIILLATGISLSAGPVKEQTALKIANNFWVKNKIIGIIDGKPARYDVDTAVFENIGKRLYNEFYISTTRQEKGL